MLLRRNLIRTLKDWNLTPEQWQTLAILTYHNQRLSKWNPSIFSLEGELKEGKTIKVQLKPKGHKNPIGFSPKVLKVEKDKHLAWKGQFFIPGLFSGQHEFLLEEKTPGKTLLTQREDFSGILLPFLNLKKTEEGFKMMNQALKERVENSSLG